MVEFAGFGEANASRARVVIVSGEEPIGRDSWRSRHEPSSPWPFSTVEKYLARYTHRVAISNHRLVKLDDGWVAFRYKDHKPAGQEKMQTFSAEEFLRRFVMHVLPKGFMKIRHYGLLSSRHREARLHQASRLLLPRLALSASACAPIKPAESARCPQCGSVRRTRGALLPREASSPFVCAPPRDSTRASAGNTS